MSVCGYGAGAGSAGRGKMEDGRPVWEGMRMCRKWEGLSGLMGHDHAESGYGYEMWCECTL